MGSQHSVLAALRICCHHQCFFLSVKENKPTYLQKVTRRRCVPWVCGLPSSVTVSSFASSLQECSSCTPAWLCWVSSSSMAACRRPKPAVWRRSKRCSKTSSVPVAPPIRTRDGRSNISESKVQTTIYRTTTHLTWTREGLTVVTVHPHDEVQNHSLKGLVKCVSE